MTAASLCTANFYRIATGQPTPQRQLLNHYNKQRLNDDFGTCQKGSHTHPCEAHHEASLDRGLRRALLGSGCVQPQAEEGGLERRPVLHAGQSRHHRRYVRPRQLQRVVRNGYEGRRNRDLQGRTIRSDGGLGQVRADSRPEPDGGSVTRLRSSLI